MEISDPVATPGATDPEGVHVEPSAVNAQLTVRLALKPPSGVSVIFGVEFRPAITLPEVGAMVMDEVQPISDVRASALLGVCAAQSRIEPQRQRGSGSRRIATPLARMLFSLNHE